MYIYEYLMCHVDFIERLKTNSKILRTEKYQLNSCIFVVVCLCWCFFFFIFVQERDRKIFMKTYQDILSHKCFFFHENLLVVVVIFFYLSSCYTQSRHTKMYLRRFIIKMRIGERKKMKPNVIT